MSLPTKIGVRQHASAKVACQVLTVSQAAEALGISRTLAYELVARSELPSVRLGRRIVVPRRVVDALLASALAQLDVQVDDG